MPQMILGDVYDLYLGIRGLGLGEKDTAKVNLKSDVRFDLAMNLRRLKAPALEYERELARLTIDIAGDSKFLNVVQNAKMNEAIALLRAKLIDVPTLKTLKKSDLKADENQNIMSETMAQLAPIITDVEWDEKVDVAPEAEKAVSP